MKTKFLFLTFLLLISLMIGSFVLAVDDNANEASCVGVCDIN